MSRCIACRRKDHRLSNSQFLDIFVYFGGITAVHMKGGGSVEHNVFIHEKVFRITGPWWKESGGFPAEMVSDTYLWWLFNSQNEHAVVQRVDLPMFGDVHFVSASICEELMPSLPRALIWSSVLSHITHYSNRCRNVQNPNKHMKMKILWGS